MTFTARHLVRFAHVDGAGIVFYPRYFELLNAVVEDYFAQKVGVDFATMHRDRRLGVPTVRLEVDFAAPSRLGDSLDFELTVTRVGRSSLDLAFRIFGGQELRVGGRLVIVCMDLDRARPVAWPDDMRPAGAAEA